MQQKSKTCEVCGRIMEWRARWAKNWDEVKYCSDQCRRSKSKSMNEIELKILELLNQRGPSVTICPSEVLSEDKKSNKVEMEKVRQAARRLVHQGKILIMQKGQVVDPSDFRGPIRLKLNRS